MKSIVLAFTWQMLVVASSSVSEECIVEPNHMAESSTGSILLQGLSQQSQLLEMSVDPEGDGLTQEHAQHAHTTMKLKPLAKQTHAHSHPYGQTKKSISASAQHGASAFNGVQTKLPSFSAHFRIGGAGEGVPEKPQKVKSVPVEEDILGPQIDEKDVSLPLNEERLSEPLQPKEEKGINDDDASPSYLQQNSEGTAKGDAWIGSQDAKMQAAVSLAKALLSLQVTPPEFIQNQVASESQRQMETKMPVATSTTTPIASVGKLPDLVERSSQSLPAHGNGARHALLETFHSQLHDNIACLVMTVVNGPLQTLAILFLLFLGYTLQKEILELKASNAELMQKISDMTPAPPTPRSDRRCFGRADSRADWLRAIEAIPVGGRE